MTEHVIVVLNAGSSSVKFSVYFKSGATLELRIRGQIEALFSAPRFVARDASGADGLGEIVARGDHAGA